MMGLILLVLAVGGATRGSRRWIELPFFRFQPSELGKVLLVLALSAFVLDRLRYMNDRQTTSRIMLLALAPTLLVMAQPDLGTGIIYVNDRARAAVRGGHQVDSLRGAGGPGGRRRDDRAGDRPAAGTPVLKGYQKDRLTAFLHKNDADPRSQGYQLNQAQTAIGSGRKSGRGAARATQTRLGFLPESHTDFIFAVVGERYGFVGAGDRLVALCAVDLACPTNTHDREEPVRGADRRGHRSDADDAGFRERRRKRWNHADHRDPVTADELRGVLGDRDADRARNPSERVRTGARSSGL